MQMKKFDRKTSSALWMKIVSSSHQLCRYYCRKSVCSRKSSEKQQKNKVASWVIKRFVSLLENIRLRLVSSPVYQLTEDDDAAMRRIIRSFRLHLCSSQCIACVRHWIPRKDLNGNVADSSEKLSVMQIVLLIFVCWVTNRFEVNWAREFRFNRSSLGLSFIKSKFNNDQFDK